MTEQDERDLKKLKESEKPLFYLKLQTRYLKRISNNVGFFFWASLIGAIITFIVLVAD